MKNKKSKEDNHYTSSPPFIEWKNTKKKLKREDYPFLNDKQFEMIQDLNDTPGEGFSVG